MPGLGKNKGRRREEVGQVIDCGKKAYCIESLLGSGFGYGDAYKVHLTKDRDKKYVMKTERFDESEEGMARIRVEINVFESIQGEIEKEIDKTHFPRMFITGRTPEYSFLIMQVVGPSLLDIRKTMMKGFTSPRTIAEIARQTLRAIQTLHEQGYLHRLIQPEKFAIGLPPSETTIFMLDFGIARHYRYKDGNHKPARRKVGWASRTLYASARAYKGEDQARRDDIESWCFMMLEYYGRNNLQWNYPDYGNHMIMAIKTKVMTESAEMRKKGDLEMPREFGEILEMTSRLEFTEAPNYARMHEILEEIVKAEKIDMTDTLDWIGKTMEVDPATVEKKDPDQEIDPVERDMQQALVRRTLAARKRQLEQQMIELYKQCGTPKTLEEVREEMRRKKGKRSSVNEDEGDDDCSKEDCESLPTRHSPAQTPLTRKGAKDKDRDRKTKNENEQPKEKKGKKRMSNEHGNKKDRSPRRKKSMEQSDEKEKPKEKEEDDKKVGNKKEQPRKKRSTENSDEKEKPKEKEESGNKAKANEVGNKKDHRPPRRQTTGSTDEKETSNEKEKVGKKGEEKDVKDKNGEVLGTRLPLAKELKKGRTTMSSEEKIEKDGKKPADIEKASPAKLSSPVPPKAADVPKKESVDVKKK